MFLDWSWKKGRLLTDRDGELKRGTAGTDPMDGEMCLTDSDSLPLFSRFLALRDLVSQISSNALLFSHFFSPLTAQNHSALSIGKRFSGRGVGPMFSLIYGVLVQILKKEEFQVLLIGVDNAGKSASGPSTVSLAQNEILPPAQARWGLRAPWLSRPPPPESPFSFLHD